MKRILLTICWGVLAQCHGHAQTNSVVGTISAFKAATAEIEIKPDAASAIAYRVTGDTVVQKVAPGMADLKQAQPIRVTDLHLGDRVLATAEPGTKELRRLVVMTASEIAQRDEADRVDWAVRGVTGIVESKGDGVLDLRMRTLTGEKRSVVHVNAKTKYKRYAPDSIRFADAKESTFEAIAPGDQVRARGPKSDGDSGVIAQEVVFGSFVTKAGAIVSVDAGAGEVSVKDLAEGKPLVIHVTPETRLKRMLDRQAMIAMMHGGSAGAHPEGGHAPGAMPPTMMSLNEMLERLPDVSVADLKTGDLVIVSSTKTVAPDHVTAISMLANAEMLLQVMAAQAGASTAGGLDALTSMGFGVMQ